MFFKKKNEFGRTMIEMLGVLGVVGLLSIAAIQGYRFINLSLEISLIEDTIYKGASLIESRQINSLTDLENFFKKTRMGMGREYVVENIDCPTKKRGIFCCALKFSHLSKNIVDHFLNDGGPFTVKSTAPTNLTLIFEVKRREPLDP